jgi:hypothetical protein
MALDVATGKELASGSTSMPGHYVVTEQHVLFFSGLGLATFDHHTMLDVERLELRNDIATLFGDDRVLIRGFAASRNAVFWTAPEGILMGLAVREDANGLRQAWRSSVPGLSPIVAAPTVFGDFMYWSTVVLPPERPSVVAFARR